VGLSSVSMIERFCASLKYLSVSGGRSWECVRESDYWESAALSERGRLENLWKVRERASSTESGWEKCGGASESAYWECVRT
jgi:hypothetical protein